MMTKTNRVMRVNEQQGNTGGNRSDGDTGSCYRGKNR